MFNSKINKNTYLDNLTDIIIDVKDEFDKKLNVIYKKVDEDLINILKNKEIYIEVSLDKNLSKTNLKKILIDYEYDNDIGYIGDVLLKLDYFERKEIEGRVFKVNLIINEIIYDAKVVLEKDYRYIKEYENLINISIKNNLIFNNKLLTLKVKGSENIHDVYMTRVGKNIYVIADIRMDSNLTVEEAHDIAIISEKNIKFRYSNIKKVIYHIEPNYIQEEK